MSNPASVRHSILDLAPLATDCMNALWPLGQATVRDIQRALAETRPRAYTTIMTILDRLAQKDVVARRKAGRAWVYRPNLSSEEARSSALAKIVDGFFDGSAQALAGHLTAQGPAVSLIFSQKNAEGAPAKREKIPCPALNEISRKLSV